MSAALPQPEDRRPASGGRSLRLWGRLWKFFRGPFHGLGCIPFRCEREHSKDGLNESRPRKGKVYNDGDIPPQKTSAGGAKAMISTGKQNNRNAQIPHLPLSPGSLDALEDSSSQSDRHSLPATTSDGADKQWAHTEMIMGTPGQQLSANLGPSMPAAQPISSPNSVPPRGDASAGPPSVAETLVTEPREEKPDHGHRDPDIDHSVSLGRGSVDYIPPENSGSIEDGNGPPSRKSTSSTCRDSDDGQSDGQNDGHRGAES